MATTDATGLFSDGSIPDLSLAILKSNIEGDYIYVRKTIPEQLDGYAVDVDGKGRFEGRFDVKGDVSFWSELDVSDATLLRNRLDGLGDVSFHSELD